MSQAIKDPSRTAGEFWRRNGRNILSFHKVFLVNWLEQVFDIGGDILGGVPKPFTPPEATPTGTACERYEFDLIEIKRKLDDSSG